MSGKPGKLLLAFTLIVLLAGWSAVQAFSFCFSFGGGGKNRSDYYNRPPPAVGFGQGIYNYPYSPVMAAPFYTPYYLPSPPPGFNGDAAPRQHESSR